MREGKPEDFVVYSTGKPVEDPEERLERIKAKIQRAFDTQNVEAFARILAEDEGVDPDSPSFQKRIESFRRNCNLD